MKRLAFVIMLLFNFAFLFGLAACRVNDRETDVNNEATEPAPQSDQTGSQEISSPEDDSPEPTALNVPADFAVRRQPDEIDLFPFTDDELADAYAIVQDYLNTAADGIGVSTYDVERIAYDPIMTDVHIRQEIADAPRVGWQEEDYYSRRICFAVTYSATYDHEKTAEQDAKHRTIHVGLCRENLKSSWEFLSSGIPVEEYSGQALSVDALKLFTDITGRILAGYETEDNEYWLYVYNESADEIHFFRKKIDAQRPSETEPAPFVSLPVWDESDYQVGEPSVIQPGDTQYTWKPYLATEYPADEDCSSLELLEKWMAVEGVTEDDLDSRGCTQLILVVAKKTNGVETYTTCFQKQSDGTWSAVDGLSWMDGWAGSNGIMHGRKRGTETSPAGLWGLGLAFGNSQKPAGLKMPWRDVTPYSDWVCDEESIYFNTWQERNDPDILEEWSDDVEHLEDYPNAYAYACVIRYNTPPYTIPERGCAIFLHCSTGATGGCIGLQKDDMVNTLLWLDPEQNPYILITGYQKG